MLNILIFLILCCKVLFEQLCFKHYHSNTLHYPCVLICFGSDVNMSGKCVPGCDCCCQINYWSSSVSHTSRQQGTKSPRGPPLPAGLSAASKDPSRGNSNPTGPAYFHNVLHLSLGIQLLYLKSLESLKYFYFLLRSSFDLIVAPIFFTVIYIIKK